MGTRNLTCVVKNNEYKVAQYGQWDGYYGGAGISILEVLRNVGTKTLLKNLDNIEFIGDDFYDTQFKAFNIVVNEHGFVTSGSIDSFYNIFPQLSRDMGYGIVEFLSIHNKENIVLKNSLDFARDSLFCEYAYVIDLDNQTLEIYEGFNQEPIDSSERFFFDGEFDKNGYYPVRLRKIYNLNQLPTNEEFLAELEPDEED